MPWTFSAKLIAYDLNLKECVGFFAQAVRLIMTEAQGGIVTRN
jgi:hypothetical protein